MSEEIKAKGSAYREASALLEMALAQLNQIKRALIKPHSRELDAVTGQATDAVVNIRSAMQSGKIDGAALASLSASLNLGVDVGALVIEEADTGQAMTLRIRLAEASVESRVAVERLSNEMFQKHLFDADVERNTHGVDLESFRRRKAEDEKYVHEQLQRHSPEGDLNASGRIEGYMLDANAHGAGDNPAFMPKWNELKAKTDRLRTSMRSAGLSTEEYDRHVRQYVTDFLKAKGMAEAQIKEALAKNENPLDAVQPYLGSDKDSREFTQSLGHANDGAEPDKRMVVATPDDGQPQTIDIDAMNARLAAAGLSASLADDATGHGLNIQKSKTTFLGHLP